jgi:hypothetical protein
MTGHAWRPPPDGSLLAVAVAVKRDGSTNDQNAVVYFWKM